MSIKEEPDFLENLILNHFSTLDYQEKFEEYLLEEFIKDFGLDQPKQLDMWREFGEY